MYEKQANFNSFILRMLVQYIDLINIAKYLLLFFTKFYEPALKKTLESARMNNSAGFSCQVFGFCPRGQLIIVRFKLTAGRDSGGYGQHLRTSFCWLNTQQWNISSIQLQFLSRTSKSVEELTQQPDSHHRVALQPPSSFEDGLDGRKERFCFQIFNCLPKALMLFFTTGETSRALLAQQQVRRFSNVSRIHTTGCFNINYCPRSSSYFGFFTMFTVIYQIEAPLYFPRRERCNFHSGAKGRDSLQSILGNLLIGRGQQHFASFRHT